MKHVECLVTCLAAWNFLFVSVTPPSSVAGFAAVVDAEAAAVVEAVVVAVAWHPSRDNSAVVQMRGEEAGRLIFLRAASDVCQI